MPQDVKVAGWPGVLRRPHVRSGVYVIDATSFKVLRIQPTGRGAHGLYISRDSKRMFSLGHTGNPALTCSGNRVRGRPLLRGAPVVAWARIPASGLAASRCVYCRL